MTASGTILLQCQVAETERPGVVAAGEQLIACLRAASGTGDWLAQVAFQAPGERVAPVPGVSAVVLSLLPEVDALLEPIAATEARWHALIQPLLACGAPVFLRTVFRHVPERARNGEANPLLERIRRLNLMASSLSHAYGLGVIDIDRAFAHLGGRMLETDWRLGGVLAAETAGHTMVWSLLSHGMDDVIDPAIQEKAREALGGLSQINRLLPQRLAQRRAAAGGS